MLNSLVYLCSHHFLKFQLTDPILIFHTLFSIPFTCICMGVSCNLARSFSFATLSCRTSSLCSLFSSSACRSKCETFFLKITSCWTPPLRRSFSARSDLKGGKKSLGRLHIAKSGDGVGELGDRGGRPPVDVALRGLQVIPEFGAVAESFCVRLYFLWNLKVK